MNNDTFNTIKDDNLRNWNQLAMLYNILAEKGSEDGADYAKALFPKDRDGLGRMIERVKTDGYESTRSAINREAQTNATAIS